MADRPVRPLLVGVVLFLLAVLVARLVLAGGIAWVVLAVVLPILVLALATKIRLLPAVVVAALFAGAVVAFRWFFLESEVAWAVLLILPAVTLGLVVAFKVVAALRNGPSLEEKESRENEEKAEKE